MSVKIVPHELFEHDQIFGETELLGSLREAGFKVICSSCGHVFEVPEKYEDEEKHTFDFAFHPDHWRRVGAASDEEFAAGEMAVVYDSAVLVPESPEAIGYRRKEIELLGG